MPHRESLDPVKLEEERRLMYVGITRAQRSLHISYSERRKQGRELIPCEPSRFIAEMGKDDLRFSGGKSRPEGTGGGNRPVEGNIDFGIDFRLEFTEHKITVGGTAGAFADH